MGNANVRCLVCHNQRKSMTQEVSRREAYKCPVYELFEHQIFPPPPPEVTAEFARSMSDKLEEGQDVSWRWGGGNPTGTVSEVVTEGKAEVVSNKGNTVSRNARGADDPAVKISRSGNDVVKLAHELNEVKEAE
ncbi:uncharacterized protein LAESUDRAFT_444825 [Laetiporus sulphureus 93-53]|uniref:Hypervirulence associated protein TUDOR domain-containing protein n=1 Tax=Laetiporus sulphureus 93-53 TaxID=1314785 RepID=A0A165C0S0_9APHY|nr:uncharacterized protein LAESUDRAFT_444825 [Laetiporus sulphureus 93-53]KZT01993.1 hypothetical protein LAESUDRAFT_444825 [Laetiporus sulphureus 93-53]